MDKEKLIIAALKKLGCIDSQYVIKLFETEIAAWNPDERAATSLASKLLAEYALNKID